MLLREQGFRVAGEVVNDEHHAGTGCGITVVLAEMQDVSVEGHLHVYG